MMIDAILLSMEEDMEMAFLENEVFGVLNQRKCKWRVEEMAKKKGNKIATHAVEVIGMRG